MKYNIKYLSFGLSAKSGINFTGKKMFKNRCSGRSKRKFRLIDFYRKNYNVPAIVVNIQYDPNRSSNVALICYRNGFLSYIIATSGLKKNDFINYKTPSSGVADKLTNFPLGSFVSSLELRCGLGSKIARSAGTYCILLNKFNNFILIKMPSGIERLFSENNIAVLGTVSNSDWKWKKKTKAGNNIWIGKRPIVRGVAKNCVDHPHGGGRGKTSPWSTQVNFTGRVRKGNKTTTNFAKKLRKKYCKI